MQPLSAITKVPFKKPGPSLCWNCQKEITPFLDFGPMPRGNGFLLPQLIPSESLFQLETAFCTYCYLVQLTDQPPPQEMFHADYPFFTNSSKKMTEHFATFANQILPQLSADSFVVEIGSNDGTFLSNLSKHGIYHLGIDPSRGVCEKARERGVQVLESFFDEICADDILKFFGQADLIYAANVFCHVAYLHAILRGVRKLLTPKGTLVFEDPYLGDVISKGSFDQIYDEHVFLFSLHSIQNMLKIHDLELIRAEPLSTHGGSMRYTVAHRNTYPIHSSVPLYLEKEVSQGLPFLETYFTFAKRCDETRGALLSILQDLKKQGKKIVGYGATSKSTTLLNYCKINSELLDYICDTTREKQGKVSPGMHLPIQSVENFHKNFPDYALLLAWNHAEEIKQKETDFQKHGGKWIHYVPKVEIQS